MPSDREVEIKFKVDDIDALTGRLQTAGFRLITPRTHEMNTLYDQPGSKLRRRGALLRLRQLFNPLLRAAGKFGSTTTTKSTPSK